MKYKIVKDKYFLNQPTKHATLEEGERIGEHLKKAIVQLGGLGLAANQIGYDKSVCLIHINEGEPIILINPRITESSVEKVIYAEGCLSIPGKTYLTQRNLTVKVAADNLANELEFKPSKRLEDEQYARGEHFKLADVGLLECVCVQHELDHLSGILITDPEIRFVPMSAPKKIKFGRNQKVLIKNPTDQVTQRVKFKNAESLLAQGWEII
jgi:peptide deformylase